MLADDQASKCFGLVSRYDPQPKRRLFEWLKAQGLQSHQPVTFLSDGGDTVRELPRGMHPEETGAKGRPLWQPKLAGLCRHSLFGAALCRRDQKEPKATERGGDAYSDQKGLWPNPTRPPLPPGSMNLLKRTLGSAGSGQGFPAPVQPLVFFWSREAG
jgi:hypothetical protein